MQKFTLDSCGGYLNSEFDVVEAIDCLVSIMSLSEVRSSYLPKVHVLLDCLHFY